jgi:hypothetical protein
VLTRRVTAHIDSTPHFDGSITASSVDVIRTLSEHAHWVNTMALSTDFVLRTGPYDHTGKVPKDDEEGSVVVGPSDDRLGLVRDDVLVSSKSEGFGWM